MMNLDEWITQAQLRRVSSRSDLKAFGLFASNYLLTAGLLTIMALWPNPVVIVAGTFLLGGRQLGFFVLVHECGHGTLFKNKALNQLAGNWFAAALTFEDMEFYARGHLEHHRLAGTAQDPDLPNYRSYPIERAALARKLWRDVSGQTGIKQTRGIFRALLRFNQQSTSRRLALARGLCVHTFFAGIFMMFGVIWLYFIWWLALLTSFRLVSRLRQVAEHANVPDLMSADPRLNTRTIDARWFDRLMFCPLGVNFHVEHHMQASVPIYNLGVLHDMLKRAGYYDRVTSPKSYWGMLSQVTS
mgnify:FL=1